MTKRKPIPVRKLRQYHRSLQRMADDLREHYPNAYADLAGPLTETIRNVETAVAEIEMWITARIAGLRKDPESGAWPPPGDR